jgi:hypothetical protein
MKKYLPRTILKLCGFFLIANLPFLTISQLVGIDTFIDSFNHPSSFLYLKNEKLHSLDAKAEYIILEQPTYQGFSIQEGDHIIYHTNKESLQQNIVNQVKSDNGITTYYTTSYTDDYNGPIYEQQIVGKVIGRSEDNIWNTLCLQLWDLSINNLNVVALFSDS